MSGLYEIASDPYRAFTMCAALYAIYWLLRYGG